MKRIIAIILLLATMTAAASCSSGGNVDFNSIKENMVSSAVSLPEMKTISDESERAETLFSSLSKLDYEKVEDFFFTYSADGSPYELAAIRLKRADDLPECEKSLSEHIKSRVSLYKNYAPENVEKAEKAQVISGENVAALIMCDNPEDVKKAFYSAVKTSEK